MENQKSKIHNSKNQTLLPQTRVSSSCSNRKRLLDTVQETHPKSRQNSAVRKLNETSKIQKNSTTLNVPKVQQDLRKKISQKNDSKVLKTRSKSPACLKRNKSEDLSKTLTVRDKSLDGLRAGGKSKSDQLSEEIIKISSKFSVQKIADLKNLNLSGNEDLVKALVILLREVDYHLQDSKNVFPDIFLEYISSPGIVVQNIKKLSYYITKCRVPEKTYSKSFEVYNNIETVSNTAGHTLLVSFLENVFKLKNLSPKSIRFLQPQEIEMTKLEKAVPETRVHLKSESFSITGNRKNDLSSDSESPTPGCSFDLRNSFRDSKQFLLDRFFNKMINPIRFEVVDQPSQPLLKELSNIPKQDSQPPSVPQPSTPRQQTDPKEEVKLKQEDKLKNLMIPTRFFKKIDEKFICLLLDKMKRDPKDLLKLKLKNFEEYFLKKNEYILKNKDQWAKEVSTLIQQTESESNENSSLQDLKSSALKDYLSQEKVLKLLISRAEHSELSYRKL